MGVHVGKIKVHILHDVVHDTLARNCTFWFRPSLISFYSRFHSCLCFLLLLALICIFFFSWAFIFVCVRAFNAAVETKFKLLMRGICAVSIKVVRCILIRRTISLKLCPLICLCQKVIEKTLPFQNITKQISAEQKSLSDQRLILTAPIIKMAQIAKLAFSQSLAWWIFLCFAYLDQSLMRTKHKIFYFLAERFFFYVKNHFQCDTNIAATAMTVSSRGQSLKELIFRTEMYWTAFRKKYFNNQSSSSPESKYYMGVSMSDKIYYFWKLFKRKF